MKRWTVVGIVAIFALPVILAACGTSSSASAPAASSSAMASPAAKDIVDTAVGAGQFTTLAKALGAAGLVDALKGPGPFTVFAPTDAAFAKLPAGTLAKLLKDPKGQLADILKYHVVSGKVMASDITNGMTATTLQGSDLKFTIKDGNVYVNGAKVVQADIPASNGVIHVIDSVLVPKQ
jgi:transforming growth factor-beta-induced protein